LNKDGTYQLELFLPASALSKENLKPGTQVRFDISILSKKPRATGTSAAPTPTACWLQPHQLGSCNSGKIIGGRQRSWGDFLKPFFNIATTAKIAASSALTMLYRLFGDTHF